VVFLMNKMPSLSSFERLFGFCFCLVSLFVVPVLSVCACACGSQKGWMMIVMTKSFLLEKRRDCVFVLLF